MFINKDEQLEYQKNWNRENPESRRETYKKYREKNKDRVLEYARKYGKKYYADNKHKWRDRSLKRYGLTRDDYDVILNSQGGGCAVCGNKDKKLNVDHCHRTGRVRSILCLHCNTALGNVFDDIGRLELLIEYLRKHQ